MADVDSTGLAAMLGWLQDRAREEEAESEREEEANGAPVGVWGTGSAALAPFDVTAVGAVTLPPNVDPNQEWLLGMSVIALGGSVAEGDIVKAVTIPWVSLARTLEKDPDFLLRYNSRRVEEIVAAAYHDDGTFDEVVLTPRSGDRGRDVIATKRGRFSIRVLDQVKRYKPGTVVTADEVRAVFGVLARDALASKAYVTTTAAFAPGVRGEFADSIPTRLELRDGKALREWIRDLARRNR